jgi:hypothetical protein
MENWEHHIHIEIFPTREHAIAIYRYCRRSIRNNRELSIDYRKLFR